MKSLLYITIFLFCGTAFSQQISEVTIQDNKKTKTGFLRKITNIKEGQPLDSLVLEKDIALMKRLPGIAHAYYQVRPKADGTYRVVYGVEENFTIIPSANVFTTNDDEFAYRLGLFEFNALGQGIVFGGSFQRDVYNSYGII